MGLQILYPADRADDDRILGLDALIRPGLRRAFPLPCDDADDRFRELLDALAQRPRRSQSAHGQTPERPEAIKG